MISQYKPKHDNGPRIFPLYLLVLTDLSACSMKTFGYWRSWFAASSRIHPICWALHRNNLHLGLLESIHRLNIELIIRLKLVYMFYIITLKFVLIIKKVCLFCSQLAIRCLEYFTFFLYCISFFVERLTRWDTLGMFLQNIKIIRQNTSN